MASNTLHKFPDMSTMTTSEMEAWAAKFQKFAEEKKQEELRKREEQERKRKEQRRKEEEAQRLRKEEERRLKELEERKLKELEERRLKELEERRLKEQQAKETRRIEEEKTKRMRDEQIAAEQKQAGKTLSRDDDSEVEETTRARPWSINNPCFRCRSNGNPCVSQGGKPRSRTCAMCAERKKKCAMTAEECEKVTRRRVGGGEGKLNGKPSASRKVVRDDEEEDAGDRSDMTYTSDEPEVGERIQHFFDAHLSKTDETNRLLRILIKIAKGKRCETSDEGSDSDILLVENSQQAERARRRRRRGKAKAWDVMEAINDSSDMEVDPEEEKDEIDSEEEA